MAWFRDMYRILRPSGILVVTTHGWRAAYSKVTDKRTGDIITEAFAQEGHWFFNAFPNNTDWDADTTNNQWGQAWAEPAWLRDQLKDMFSMKLLLNARNDCLQDVILLQRII